MKSNVTYCIIITIHTIFIISVSKSTYHVSNISNTLVLSLRFDLMFFEDMLKVFLKFVDEDNLYFICIFKIPIILFCSLKQFHILLA